MLYQLSYARKPLCFLPLRLLFNHFPFARTPAKGAKCGVLTHDLTHDTLGLSFDP